jgi:signal transduction histidine kinase
LSISKKIVEAHRGTISVNSQPMQGAEFTVRLPVAPGLER